MSHGKLRHEKNCLNCGSIVKGPYCHICGQHNIVTQESVWDIITHFVYDITHFDGKFFQGIKMLLFKPGFLSKEYMRGRRAAYMNPIRFYVFTSAFFFLIMFQMTESSDVVTFGSTEKKLEGDRKELLKELKNASDSSEYERIAKELRENDSLIVLYEKIGLIEKSKLIDDTVRAKIVPAVDENSRLLGLDDSAAKTVKQYDSIQNSLPASERDGWLKRYVKRKVIQINKKYEGRPKEFSEKFSEIFIHSIPKMMFISMPLVAFFLWLLYKRKNQYYYTNHAILVIHDYIAIYLVFLVVYLVQWLESLLHWSLFNWLRVILILYSFYYVYKSMRNFYEEKRARTILKYSLFLLMVLIMFFLLFAIFIINTIIKV